MGWPKEAHGTLSSGGVEGHIRPAGPQKQSAVAARRLHQLRHGEHAGERAGRRARVARRARRGAARGGGLGGGLPVYGEAEARALLAHLRFGREGGT